MNDLWHHRPSAAHFVSLLGLILLVAACTASPGSSSAAPSVVAPTSTVAPSVSAPASAAPVSPAPPPSTFASPPTATTPSPQACTLPGPGPLASDTLRSASLERTATGSRLTFVFGTRPPEAVAQPTIGLGFVQPPFSMAGSGQPVAVTGERFLKIRMGGMVAARPSGEPVYTGERDLRSAGGTIRQAVMVDESEGVVTWIVGLTGTACPTVTRDAVGGEKLVVELAD